MEGLRLELKQRLGLANLTNVFTISVSMVTPCGCRKNSSVLFQNKLQEKRDKVYCYFYKYKVLYTVVWKLKSSYHRVID